MGSNKGGEGRKREGKEAGWKWKRGRGVREDRGGEGKTEKKEGRKERSPQLFNPVASMHLTGNCGQASY